MRLHIYSIYDAAVGAYMPPFFVRAEREAIRSLESLLASPQPHAFKESPADYQLYHLGMYDDADAQIATNDAPRLVTTVQALLSQLNAPSTPKNATTTLSVVDNTERKPRLPLDDLTDRFTETKTNA